MPFLIDPRSLFGNMVFVWKKCLQSRFINHLKGDIAPIESVVGNIKNRYCYIITAKLRNVFLVSSLFFFTTFSQVVMEIQPLNQKWNAPELGLVDAIVEVLKRSGRWQLDGPNVRLTNKAWSEALGVHVTSAGSCIKPDDFNSLHKFPNIVSITIPNATTRFFPPFEEAFNENLTKQEVSVQENIPFFISASDIASQNRILFENFKSMVGILCNMKRLRHLTLRSLVAGEGQERSMMEQLAKIKTLKSLRMDEITINDETSISALSKLDLEELEIDGSRREILHAFVRSAPNLKFLKIRFYRCKKKPSQEVFDGINIIKSVEVIYTGGRKCEVPEWLTQFTTVETLCVRHIPINNIEGLLSMNALRRLSIFVESMNIGSETFGEIMSRLDELCLRGKKGKRDRIGRIGNKPVMFQKLDLYDLRFDGFQLFSQIKSVKKLLIQDCVIESNIAFFRGVTFEKLTIIGCTNKQGKRIRKRDVLSLKS